MLLGVIDSPQDMPHRPYFQNLSQQEKSEILTILKHCACNTQNSGLWLRRGEFLTTSLTAKIFDIIYLF